MKHYKSDVTDREWNLIRPFLERDYPEGGRPLRYTKRSLFNAIRTPKPSASVVDIQSIKTTEEAGKNKGYDGGKKVLGRKRHILVDTQGNLQCVYVGPANENDREGLLNLLKLAQTRGLHLKHIWADMGYSSKDLQQEIKKSYRIYLDIIRCPSKWGWFAADTTQEEINEKLGLQEGFQVLPRRWVVERRFAWLRRFWRLAKDYERLLETSTNYIYLAMSLLLCKRLCSNIASNRGY